MSNRKIMQTPNVRQNVPGGRRRHQQTRGFWEWLYGEVWG